MVSHATGSLVLFATMKSNGGWKLLADTCCLPIRKCNDGGCTQTPSCDIDSLIIRTALELIWFPLSRPPDPRMDGCGSPLVFFKALIRAIFYLTDFRRRYTSSRLAPITMPTK